MRNTEEETAFSDYVESLLMGAYVREGFEKKKLRLAAISHRKSTLLKNRKPKTIIVME